MKLFRNVTLAVGILFLGAGCSTFSTEHLAAEGALASGFCVKGGYALAGGVVVGAKVNKDFKGSIAVTPECAVGIQSE